MVVPDITIDGAFDNVLQDVKYVLHIASPVPGAVSPSRSLCPQVFLDFSSLTSYAYQLPQSDDLEKSFIVPAQKGTLNLLRSAAKNSSVRRIVVTSSMAAILPLQAFSSSDPNTVYLPTSRREDVLPGPYSDSLITYAVSK